MQPLTYLPLAALLVALAAPGLAACGATGAAAARPVVAQTAPTPAALAPTLEPTGMAVTTTFERVSGTGQIVSAQDATLVFLVSGRVERILVEEGQAVRRGDLLASLDPRPFDEAVRQAEAGLAAARAQQSALDEGPRGADVRAAKAQVHAAEIAVAQATSGQQQGVIAAQAGLDLARANLQTTRDRLSAAKTQAEIAVAQAAEALTQAQARYAQAKANWDYVEEHDKDPAGQSGVVYVPDPNPSNPAHFQPQKVEGKLTEAARRAYQATFIQAEAAMRQAEESVRQAQVAAEAAHQGEIAGIQIAEQQVVQAQAALDRVALPADHDSVASAQAGLDLARANLARLNSDPNQSQRSQVAAAVAAAEATLAQARLSREYAELRAPFDGVVTSVGVELGEAAGPAGRPALLLVDTGALRFEVPIPEVDIARVARGQRAEVRLDALPGAALGGTVSYIADAATSAGNARTYLVRIDLAGDPRVKVGMSGQAALSASE